MSESEANYSSSNSESCTESSSDSEDDFGVAGGPVEAYQFEPLAPEGYEEPEVEADEDGLTPAVLESRFEQEVTVDSWCKCGDCKHELLTGAREYRCCREVNSASGKLAFDGIEDVTCITKHPDFEPLINETVLRQVCPLLKDKTGKSYRYPARGGQNAKNECLRATAYRWLVRWIFGHLGWDNSRPLPACIYERVRRKFPTVATRGYRSALERQ